MKITIVFYKSSSKYYDSVCLQCEGFEGFSQEKSKNVLEIGLSDIRHRFSELRSILDIIKYWKRAEYFIDGEKVNLSNLECIFSIIDCEHRCSQCELIEEYCYDNTGWGCMQIDQITLRRNLYLAKKRWYEFGFFENGVWVVNKVQIRSIIQKEICEKYVDVCKHFSFERIEKDLEMLPDVIEVTDEGEWEYKYRDAPVGMGHSEIIGVKPKEKQTNGFSGAFSMSLFRQDKKEETPAVIRYIPSITFKSIGGIDESVQQVREVIELPLIAPVLFKHYHIHPHKGILLYGPPGCGKTLIAKAVANEIKAHFIPVSGPEVLNKYLGQSEENLRRIFDEAARMSPSIIYFDEFDSISTTRDADGNPLMATVVNQLLTLMDGIEDSNKICVIASTNRVDMIDDAIRRPGRFDYVIEVQRPSSEGCRAIFRIHTEGMPIEAGFNKEHFVDSWLTGCTGAEIAFVASEAAYNSLRRTVDIGHMFESGQEVSITDNNVIIEMDFIKAAKKLKERVKNERIQKYN